MCLAVPAEVVEVLGLETAKVCVGGIRKNVSTALLDEPAEVGDWVLVHVGYALEKLNVRETEETLRQMAEEMA